MQMVFEIAFFEFLDMQMVFEIAFLEFLDMQMVFEIAFLEFADMQMVFEIAFFEFLDMQMVFEIAFLEFADMPMVFGVYLVNCVKMLARTQLPDINCKPFLPLPERNPLPAAGLPSLMSFATYPQLYPAPELIGQYLRHCFRCPDLPLPLLEVIIWEIKSQSVFETSQDQAQHEEYA